jgi:hypothetical protein
MEWYWVQMNGDPEAGNVFGREALRLRREPMLEAWLKAGGRLSDFLMLRQAQHEEFLKFPRAALRTSRAGMTLGEAAEAELYSSVSC